MYNDWNDKFDGMPIFKILGESPFSHGLLRLSIKAADKGMNGTQNWDLKVLLESKNVFANLYSFELPLNSQENHNRIIVTYKDLYEENNGIGLLLDKCPSLKHLAMPSAPGKKFFEREFHVLENLIIQTGYNHQNFIKNLSNSKCFKKLENLIFRDYSETYMDDFKENFTKYEDYLLLANTPNLPSLKSIIIQDCRLDNDQKHNLSKEALKNSIKLNFEQFKSA